MNEAFVAFWSTLILICRTSCITLCGKSWDLERKYVVFATPVSQKRRRQPFFFFFLDSLSAQMNVPNTKFSGKTTKHLNHNASTLSWNEVCCASDNHNYMFHTCANEFFKFELQLSSYWQSIKFSRYCPKFHIFTKIVIFQVYLQLFRLTTSPL